VASALLTLPDTQLGPLKRAYAQSRAAKRRITLLGIAIMVACLAVSFVVAEIKPDVLFKNIGRFTSYIGRIFVLDSGQPVWTDIYGTKDSWYWGLNSWLKLIGETIMIAYLGTVMGALGALVCCFLAASNLVTRPWVLFLARRFLEFCRTVPELVFALTFVVAFGLGPLPGVLAIAIHTLGALGKQYAEVVENIDMNPFEGLTSTGATWWESVRFAALPQVVSNFASYGLMRFEVNVRGAAIMGFVGAGGIGQDLLTAIRKFYYSDVSAILLLIIVTVFIIDMVTERIRHRLLGQERAV
jgi:phosphonate transport system permease protein